MIDCFMLGMEQRSGTNYLANLLSLHPQCEMSCPPYEDYFLKDSSLLCQYVDGLFEEWTSEWEMEKNVGSKEYLLSLIGEALIKFVRNKKQLISQKNEIKCVFSKTPCVIDLENIFKLFPQSKLIILIRDGRAVIESGVRSFGWRYEEAIKGWVNSAERIIKFIGEHENNNQYILVRYEDLVKNTDYELNRIFDYLNLDSNLYDFGKAASIEVVGSSDLKACSENIDWIKRPRTNDFNPILRFNTWSQNLHARYNWLAEKQHRALGYDIHAFTQKKWNYLFYNLYLDLKWFLMLRFKLVLRGVKLFWSRYKSLPRAASKE